MIFWLGLGMPENKFITSPPRAKHLNFIQFWNSYSLNFFGFTMNVFGL